MLKKVSFPLTNGQLSDFILDKGYTTYFTLQEAINELQETNLISKETVRNSSHYHITEEGTSTLEYFKSMIPKVIQTEIDTYLKENKLKLRDEVSILADYYKTTVDDEYAVHCIVKEGKSNLIDLTVTVPDRDQAILMCDHWRKKCQSVYSLIMNELM